jgi:hypothetical protein
MTRAAKSDRTRAREARDYPDALLKHSEAAVFLSVSPSWLYQSAVPFVRIGARGRRYDPRELRAFIAANKSHSIIGDRP